MTLARVINGISTALRMSLTDVEIFYNTQYGIFGYVERESGNFVPIATIGQQPYVEATGINNYTGNIISPTPFPAGLGQQVAIKFFNGNTASPVTIQFPDSPPLRIVDRNGNDLLPGAIISGQTYQFILVDIGGGEIGFKML